jgi:anti-anti-sigma factor
MVIEQSVAITYPRSGAAVVTLTGEHDLVNADETSQLLKELLTHNDLVVVDLGEATFIDSSLIRTLFLADENAREQGKKFRLQLGTASLVSTALRVSGALSRIDVAMSREEALSADGAPARQV